MGKAPLTRDSQFIVGEEKILIYIIGILFLALFGYGVFDAANRKFVNIDFQSYVFALAIIPAVYCFRRARSGKIYIRVNIKGIYEQERLVTDWPNLIRVALTQREKKRIIEIQDNFQLVVEYRKAGSQQMIRRKINLTNTQNKSEEDVLAAIRFFWKEYQK
jgi:hypothetical protein